MTGPAHTTAPRPPDGTVTDGGAGDGPGEATGYGPDDAAAQENTELALAYLRGLRHRHRRTVRRQRAYVGYCVLLLPAIWGGPYLLAAGRAAGEQRWHGPTADRALDLTVAGVPVVVALVLLVAARVATWRGPVLLEPAAVTWLLPQPLARAPLTLPPLRFAALLAAGVGAAVGAVTGYLMFTLGAGVWWQLLAAATGAGAATGLLAVAVGVRVQRHQRDLLTRWRWWWPAGWGLVGALALTGPAAAAAGVPAATSVALWSGPWGWAALPLAAVTSGAAPPPGVGVVAGVVGALLTTGCVLLLGRDALAGAPLVEAGVLRGQAGARHRFTAALYAMDPGLARAAARSAWPPGTRRLPRWGVRWPRSGRRLPGWFLVPARDLTGLLREWGGPVRSCCWLAVTVPLLAVPGLPGPVRWLAWPAAFLAVRALGGPARSDGEDPRRSAALPWPPRHLARRHTLVPAVLAGAGLLAAVGVVAWGGAWQPGLLLLPAAAPLLASAVVLDAYRGTLPQEYLAGGARSAGNTGSLVAVVWYLRGALVALVGSAPAAAVALSGPDSGAVVLAAAWTAAVTVLTAWWAGATAARSARRG